MARREINRLEFDFGGRDEFSDAYRELGNIDRQIPRFIDQAIQKLAKELKKEAAAKALEQPATKGGHTGLRKDVAKGIGIVDIPDGVRITTSMPEEDEAIIPRGLDTEKGWRHPVFGKKDVWVRQRGEFSWFMDTMQDAKPRLGSRIEEILDDAAEQVARD